MTVNPFEAAPEPTRGDEPLVAHARHHLARAWSFWLTKQREIDEGRMGGRIYGAALDRYCDAALLGTLFWLLHEGSPAEVAANAAARLCDEGDAEHIYLALRACEIDPDSIRPITLGHTL